MTTNLPTFTTIAALLQAMNVAVTLTIEDFFILSFKNPYPGKREYMPPFRKQFYQIVFLEKGKSAWISLNSNTFEALENVVFFNGPGHVYAYHRDTAQEGFIIYFTDEFIRKHYEYLPSEFPFFKVTELNLLRLTNTEMESLLPLFELIYKEHQTATKWQIEAIQHLLVLILLKLKTFFEAKNNFQSQHFHTVHLTERFQQLVNNYFLEHKRIHQYARMLNISASYLTEIVSARLGKSPKEVLNHRLVVEAKNLLAYTTWTIAEIAFHLGFADPTAFGKFFKKQTGDTPSYFRQEPKN